MVGAGSGDVVVVVVPRGQTDAADRAVLPATAAWALGIDPAGVRVGQRCPHCGSTGHGVPYVAAPTQSLPGTSVGAGPSLSLSLSRAGGWVAVAATFAGPVGVDIESVTAVGRASLDGVLLSPAERAAERAGGRAGVSPSAGPGSVPGAAAARALAGTWCAKEAILKAAGVGLRVDPRDLTLAAGEAEAAEAFASALADWPNAGFPLAAMRLARFEPGGGLVGRVAVLAGPGAPLRVVRVPAPGIR